MRPPPSSFRSMTIDQAQRDGDNGRQIGVSGECGGGKPRGNEPKWHPPLPPRGPPIPPEPFRASRRLKSKPNRPRSVVERSAVIVQISPRPMSAGASPVSSATLPLQDTKVANFAFSRPPQSPQSQSTNLLEMAMNKRLVICCDGTWQASDGGTFEVPTNVTRLSRAIKPIAMVDGKAVQQIVYYQSGVGTGNSTWSRVVGGATGEGLSENVREAYGFLANNFHSGDSIILIGFSRGAYTARAISGLINRIGILTRKAMDDFHKIYAEYRDKTRPIPPYIDTLYHRNDGEYFHRNSRYVTAIACFDTVGSLGIPGSIWKKTGFNAKYEFRDTGINIGKIGHAFHALALDERRASFTPTMWEVPPITAQPKSDAASISLARPTQVRQCWFPGVHTNVGGGYDDQEIADVTLAWMVEMLQTVAGALEFCDNYIDYIVKNENCHSSGEWAEGMLYDSVQGIFRLGSKAPRTPGRYGTLPGQHTVAGECIHSSVRVRMQRMAEAAKLDNKKKPWVCPALQGWEFVPADSDNDTTSVGVKWKWIKRAVDGSIELELEEPPLGRMEKKIAGRRVIEKYFGKEEWDLGEHEVVNQCGEGHRNKVIGLVEAALGLGNGTHETEEVIAPVAASAPEIRTW